MLITCKFSAWLNFRQCKVLIKNKIYVKTARSKQTIAFKSHEYDKCFTHPRKSRIHECEYCFTYPRTMGVTRTIIHFKEFSYTLLFGFDSRQLHIKSMYTYIKSRQKRIFQCFTSKSGVLNI